MQGNQSFLDKNTVLATVLILIIWLGWGYFNPPVPVPSENKTVDVSETKKTSQEEKVVKVESQYLETKTITEKKENILTYNEEGMEFSVSSKGMGIKDIVLHKYKDRKMQSIHFYNGKDIYNFETQINSKVLYFNIEKVSPSEFLGVYEDEQYKIEKRYTVDTKKYTIAATIRLESKTGNIEEVQTYIVDQTLTEPEQSIFNPSFERQEVFVNSNNSAERELFYVEKPVEQTWGQVAVAALSSHYFTAAIIDRSKVIPKLQTIFDAATKETRAVLYYPKINKKTLELETINYIGPKKLSILGSVDEKLSDAVDFGFFSVLAKPILKLLVFLYDIVHNYGVAIIFLTILVRIAVLPFNVMSYKSMKSMQTIQPILKKIREKHKDDAVKMNQELMAVMKEHRVNPLGGCLPMLLQFPIFIALYQVLGQSIELYQAPFALWIHDLSLKDPFYILPVLMGITMFLQQKLTPTTMDPTQAKVMMFMPVVFSFMMVALPSGLTLYIFISTLFAVVQQKILMKTV